MPSSAITTSSTPSASPTPTTSSSSPSQKAASQATALIPGYYQELDTLYLDPMKPLNDIYSVATADEARTEIVAIGRFRSHNYRQTGKSVLAHVSVDKVDLTNSPKSNPAKYPTVTLTACVDVSGVRAVDSKAQSIVPANRKKYLISTLTVVNLKYPDSSSWRVSEAPNRQGDTCAG
jgi:hypothetical protein